MTGILEEYVGKRVELIVGHNPSETLASARITRVDPTFVEVEAAGRRRLYPINAIRSIVTLE